MPWGLCKCRMIVKVLCGGCVCGGGDEGEEGVRQNVVGGRRGLKERRGSKSQMSNTLTTHTFTTPNHQHTHTLTNTHDTNYTHTNYTNIPFSFLPIKVALLFFLSIFKEHPVFSSISRAESVFERCRRDSIPGGGQGTMLSGDVNR